MAAPIPTVVLLYVDSQPLPHVLSTEDVRGLATVTVHLFHAIRRARTRSDIAVPTGILYTATGAHRLDDVLDRIWTGPEADLLRAMPTDIVFTDAHLAQQEDTQRAFDRIWADHLAAFGVKA